MSLLERSEEKYIDIYLEEAPKFVNQGMRYGKKVADALENDEMTGDMLLDIALANLPKFDAMDEEVSAELNGVPLFGKIDSLDTVDLSGFKEYKTGRTKWSQRKADKHGQIDFYCTLIYGKYEIKPEDLDIELVYLPTDYDDRGNLQVVGDMYRFPIKKTLTDVMAMSARQKKAWERIKELSIDYLT